MVSAIGYVRCSTEEQARSGLGLSAQRAAIEAECERRGWTVDIREEVASSRHLRARVSLLEAMRELDKGIHQALIVSRLDRLSRSVGEFATFLEQADRRGWTVVCLDPAVDMGTPMGKAMAGMASVFAQLERDLIGQRTREALAAKVASGWQHPRWTTPYGPEVMQAIACMRHHKSEDIAEELQRAGIKISARTVRKHRPLKATVPHPARYEDYDQDDDEDGYEVHLSRYA